MLEHAHAGHFAALRALIRQSAAEGSFDGELASYSEETALFFANLREALATGQFVVQDARGVLSRVAVSGYVYRLEGADPLASPVGFGLFRAFGDFGFELWLTGVAAQWRGNGHGRSLLRALLATPVGRLAFVVRVQSEGRGRAAMERLLGETGYAVCRETPSLLWFVRTDAPQSLRTRVLSHAATPH